MGPELLFWLSIGLLVVSLAFSRNDVERWRRMLSSNIVLIGLGSFAGAISFFPGIPGIILGLAGLLPASVAAMQLPKDRVKHRSWNRPRFQLRAGPPEVSTAEELLREHDEIDHENERRKLGRRLWPVFLPGLAMGATAWQFGNWLMGAMAAGATIAAAWTVRPAFRHREALSPGEAGGRISRGEQSLLADQIADEA